MSIHGYIMNIKQIMTVKKRTFIIYLSSLLLLGTILSSCDSKDNDDLVPSYLHIEKLDLSTTFSQGTASSSITDAWVYIDGTLIGCFELPATIPLLYEGKQNVTVRPGIKINGIANTRSIYPFYADLKDQIVLLKDSVINWTKNTVTYKSNTLFPWQENFELSGISLDTTSKSTVDITKTSDSELIFPEQDNFYSGMITMDQDTSIFEAVTVEKFEFPSSGNSVFLEMNYKINHNLVVGVFYLASGLQVQRPLIILNKTDEWKKIYINLTVPKYDTPSATDFQVFFGAEKKDGTENAVFLLDNIKLVHFNMTK